MNIDYEIQRTKASVEKELLSLKDVTGVGVGEKIKNGKGTGIPSIRVYVKKKIPKGSLPKDQVIPDEINGIPTDVIERQFVLHPASLSLDDIRLMADSGTYNPLTGGISIGPCRVVDNHIFVGTLGLVVEDNDSDEAMMLSNFHVMCVDSGWNVGDTMVQPGRAFDGGSCPNDVVGELTRASLGGQVDCAIARITNRNHNCQIKDIGQVDGTATAVLNEPVRKRGRTTELTHGFVDDTSLSVSIDYGDGLGTKILTNQIGISVDTSQSTKIGDHGDSGSVVVNQNNKVIGLYFAGSDDGAHGVANPISAVLSALNIHLCTPDRGQTAPWLDVKRPWDDYATNVFLDMLKPSFSDTLLETIFEGGNTFFEHGTFQETGGFTLQEGLGGFNPPGQQVNLPPVGGAPFALATPHHAAGAAKMEQQQGNPGEERQLESQIEQARQYLNALESLRRK